MTMQIMKSNTGAAGPLSGMDPLGRDMPITNVTIETKDLKDADAHLSFTCHVNMQPSTNTTLIFIIKKYCDKGSTHEIGSSYVFTGQSTDSVKSKIFSFQFIDKDIHPGKYTYSVQLASNSICDCGSSVTVTNATLKVIAIGTDKGGKGGSSSSSSSSSSSGSSSGSSSSSSSSSSSADASSSSDSSQAAAAENSDNQAQADAKADNKDSKDNKDKKDNKDNKDKNKKDDKKENKEKDNKEKDNKEKNHKDK